MTITPLSFPKTFYGEATPAAEASPLSPAHLKELELANKRSTKVRRAAVVATVDAWIAAIFAGLTILSGIFSPTALLLGAALGAIAFNSFRGARRFRSFDLAAPRLLALNQVALAGILITYAAWSLWLARDGTSLFAGAVADDPDLASALAPYKQLGWFISLAVYGGLIVGTIFAQGLAALYYASRKKHLAAYLADTPAWILDLQKAQASR